MADTYAYSVGVIGAGVMGEALIAAILKSGVVSSKIAITDKRSERTKELEAKYGCYVATLEEIASKAENIFLVVKPQDLNVLDELQDLNLLTKLQDLNLLTKTPRSKSTQ